MQGTTMERSKLQALATELAKDIKSEADLNALSRELLKLTAEIGIYQAFLCTVHSLRA